MYNAAVWLREVKRNLGDSLGIRWRSFPLEQVNSQDVDYVFWEQPEGEAKSLLAFLAAESARDQGQVIFQEFVFQLLEAVHQRKMRVHELETITDVAARVPGLDWNSLLSGMRNLDLRQKIAEDYREAVDLHGVFGTPTLLFDGGDAVFLKMTPSPAGEALDMFRMVRELSCGRTFVQELKKPRKPE